MKEQVSGSMTSTSVTFSFFFIHDLKKPGVRSYKDAIPLPGLEKVAPEEFDGALEKIVGDVRPHLEGDVGNICGFRATYNNGKRSAKQTRLVYFTDCANHLFSRQEKEALDASEQSPQTDFLVTLEKGGEEDLDALAEKAGAAEAFLVVTRNDTGFFVPVQKGNLVVNWRTGELYFPKKPEEAPASLPAKDARP